MIPVIWLSGLMRKILPYLILNVIVSAVTMLVVLTIWQKAQQKSLQRELPRNTETPIRLESQSTLPPLDVETVVIEAVIGAGDIESERVQLVNVISEAVDLTGW